MRSYPSRGTPLALRKAPACRLAALSPLRGPTPAPADPRRAHPASRGIRYRICDRVRLATTFRRRLVDAGPRLLYTYFIP